MIQKTRKLKAAPNKEIESDNNAVKDYSFHGG